MLDAGAIVGKMGMEISGYAQGMLQATAIAQLFPASVTAFLANPLLGVISLAKEAAGAIAGAFRSTAARFDDMGEAAERAGLKVETLSGMGHVAQMAGSSLQGVAEAAKFLQQNMQQAMDGNEQARNDFARLGLTLADVEAGTKDLDGFLFRVGDSLAALPTNAAKTTAAMSLMGRGGTELIPVFNKGAVEIQRLMGEAGKLGAVITAEDARIGDRVGDLRDHFSQAWEGIQNIVARPILKWAAEHFDEFLGAAKSVVAWFRENWPKIWETIQPVLEGAWVLLQAVGRFIAEELNSSLAKLGPVLTVIANVLGVILRVIAAIVDAATEAIRVLTTVVTLGMYDPTAPRARTGDKAGAAGGGGGTKVEIKQLNLPPLDVAAASTAVAAAIQPHLREAVRRRERDLASDALAQRVGRGL
jgi:hypothetical protein